MHCSVFASEKVNHPVHYLPCLLFALFTICGGEIVARSLRYFSETDSLVNCSTTTQFPNLIFFQSKQKGRGEKNRDSTVVQFERLCGFWQNVICLGSHGSLATLLSWYLFLSYFRRADYASSTCLKIIKSFTVLNVLCALL